MKKLIALLLAVMLLTGTAAVLAEEAPAALDPTEELVLEVMEAQDGKLIRDGVEYTLYLERVPEGYTQRLTNENGYPEIIVESADPTKPIYYANIECEDTLDATFNYATLSDENKLMFRQEAESLFAAPETEELVTEHGTPYLLIDETDCPTDWALLTTLYKGFIVNVYVFSFSEDGPLTEEELTIAKQMMSDVWPVEVIK